MLVNDYFTKEEIVKAMENARGLKNEYLLCLWFTFIIEYGIVYIVKK